MKFYEKLIKLRKQKGISQEELADVLDVSRQSVYKWEAGTNMPDMAKLKEMTKYFKVNFDYLLDDGIEESEPDFEAKISKSIKFRDVYCSKVKLDISQAEYEHGYAKKESNKIKNSEEIFETLMKETNKYLKDKGYENILYLQQDLCICYFEDPKNKTFGIYFNGAEQFVCPFENLIDVQITNTGASLNQNNKVSPTVGLFAGGIKGLLFGVESQSQPELQGPDTFKVNIMYFDKEGASKEYILILSAIRIYHLIECKCKQEEVDIEREIVSKITQAALNSLEGKLRGVKAQAELIQAKKIKVEEIDVESIKKQSEERTKLSLQINEQVELAYKEKRKKTWIRRGIIWGSIIAFIGIVSLF